jgi:hypothetical protein
LWDRFHDRVRKRLSIRGDFCHGAMRGVAVANLAPRESAWRCGPPRGGIVSKNQKKRAQPTINVDAIVLAVNRVEGKLPAEDHARLRAIADLLFEVREELRSSDASMDRLRLLMRRVRGVPA